MKPLHSINRTTINLVLDFGAAVTFLGMLATGYILWIPLPRGTNNALTLWGMGRHQWGDVHLWISVVLLGILLVHVALHWEWLVETLRHRFGLAGKSPSQVLASGITALAGLCVAFALFAWFAGASVEHHAAKGQGAGRPHAAMMQQNGGGGGGMGLHRMAHGRGRN